MANRKDRAGTDDGAWFAPKRVGYGSGMPINWRGWVLLALHIAAICGFSTWATNKGMLESSAAQLAAYIAGVTFIALLPFPLYAAKTRGGWQWRSEKK